MAHVVEDDEDWGQRDFPLWKDADEGMSLCIPFGEIQSRCFELCIKVTDKAGAVFRLALQCLNAL